MKSTENYLLNIDNSIMDRIILHCDLNNFYASVAEIYRPECKNGPMAIAGNPKNRQGIILAKNKLAKEYGIKTAETIWQAKKKCPNLVLIEPNFKLYNIYSKSVYKIYEKYTDKIESFGIDECWLDISDSYQLFGSIKHCAFLIKEEIKKELGLTISVGISYNKIYAKLGSDISRNDEITLIDHDNQEDIVYPLKANQLLYVGERCYEKLTRLNIYTIGDLTKADPKLIMLYFKESGLSLISNAKGENKSPVRHKNDKPIAKSITKSTTTANDMISYDEVFSTLSLLAQSVASTCKKNSAYGCTITINYKTTDLKNHSLQKSLDKPTNIYSDIYNIGKELFKANNTMEKPIRSIGIGLKNLIYGEVVNQLSIFDDLEKSEKTVVLENTLDSIKSKYGNTSIYYAFNKGKYKP